MPVAVLNKVPVIGRKTFTKVIGVVLCARLPYKLKRAGAGWGSGFGENRSQGERCDRFSGISTQEGEYIPENRFMRWS